MSCPLTKQRTTPLWHYPRLPCFHEQFYPPSCSTLTMKRSMVIEAIVCVLLFLLQNVILSPFPTTKLQYPEI